MTLDPAISATQILTAPAEIVALVRRFDEQREAYRSGKYNETQLRRDFLDPLFEALGWDMTNRKNYSERYREVINEVSVEVDGAARAADYAFQSGGNILFFLEAKKPAVNIEHNPDPAFQIRRYAWSAKLPISVLSDFEQMAVYDCRAKPAHGDPASLGRVKLFSYPDYVTRWDEIYRLFSYQAVHEGALDQFAETFKGKHGTADVDDAFLVEMERWREELARNIALRNPALGWRQINTAVQTIIDRIIFLRICEERGIEAENALCEATDGKDVYADLQVLFRQADNKYNSGLFHFSEEKGQSSYPDTFTPSLRIDDRVLKDILANLYYPKSPYAFKYIPADILGQIYERFLGKVIRLTAGHQAKVEEKPEVRKAGGVYYTPTYIVDYIVRNTVGELLKEATPETLKNRSLRVLDPACGSGSFLLGAYQYLLDWYLDWYVHNEPGKWAKGKNPPVFETRSGWSLTMAKKKDILTSHIFGMDIDAQAVEVTKLSLLLKVVENPGQLSLLGERILPDLGRNIQCGNSLIGPDYYDGVQPGLFGDEEQYRVNVFDWQSAFPQAFQEGGFDAVIGNPPYIRIQALKEWAPTEVEFYKKRYVAASKGNYDIYVVFVEKGLSLLNSNGRLGFILPHKFFNAQYGEPLRGLIAYGKHLAKVVHFGDRQVFDGATTYTCLMFLDKKGKAYFEFEKVPDLKSWRISFDGICRVIDSGKLSHSVWNISEESKNLIFDHLTEMPAKMIDLVERIAQGIRTSANEVYVLDSLTENNKICGVKSKILDQEVQIEREILYLFLQGRDIKRYRILQSGKYVIIPYTKRNGKSSLLESKEFSNKYPLAFNYLLKNKKYLEDREHGKMRGSNWYGYVYPKNFEVMSQPKILIPDIADHAQFVLDEKGEYAFTSGYGITFKQDIRENQKYILGLLNSKLLENYLKHISTPMQNGFFRYFTQFIEKLPIRTINFSDPTDAARHERMVTLVESMLELHKRLSAAGLPDEKERLQRLIDQTDRQIDKLVYELYNLTEDEIKIVES